jgi:hypothetical protein
MEVLYGFAKISVGHIGVAQWTLFRFIVVSTTSTDLLPIAR